MKLDSVNQHFVATNVLNSPVDILEVMGGEARTTQVLVKRSYRAGFNFDCVVGFDLMRRDDETALYDYIRRTHPFIVVMAPQCTGLAGWGSFNAMMNPEAHQQSLKISLHLGAICAKCAVLQLEAQPRRHFFAEQPADSVLYQQPEWVYVAHIRGVTWTYMEMCMAGLVSTRGRLLMKPSELWASHEILLVRFRRMRCDHRHQHEQIEGGGNHARRKFGLGHLHGRSLTASRTSFSSKLPPGTTKLLAPTSSLCPMWTSRRTLPPDVPLYLSKWTPKKLTQTTRDYVGVAERAATALSGLMLGTLVNLTVAVGHLLRRENGLVTCVADGLAEPTSKRTRGSQANVGLLT